MKSFKARQELWHQPASTIKDHRSHSKVCRCLSRWHMECLMPHITQCLTAIHPMVRVTCLHRWCLCLEVWCPTIRWWCLPWKTEAKTTLSSHTAKYSSLSTTKMCWIWWAKFWRIQIRTTGNSTTTTSRRRVSCSHWFMTAHSPNGVDLWFGVRRVGWPSTVSVRARRLISKTVLSA